MTDVTGAVLGNPMFEEITTEGLSLIGKIVHAIADAHAGKLDPAQALGHIKAMHDQLAMDRAAVDKQLADKFDTSTSG